MVGKLVLANGHGLEEGEYFVERLENKRDGRDGQAEYKVKCLNYPESE